MNWKYSLIGAMLLLGNVLQVGIVIAETKSRIVFLGDSLTAGLGLAEDQAYPGLIGKRLKEKNLPFEVVNAGVGGDTTAGGLRRLGWLLQQPVDVLVIALGGNDGLRGVEPESIGNNLREIISLARSKNPNIRILLFGMYVPPSMGGPYVKKFADIFSTVAHEANVAFRPFLLEGVAGLPHLSIDDGIHPNVEGQQIIAESVWEALQPLLVADPQTLNNENE